MFPYAFVLPFTFCQSAGAWRAWWTGTVCNPWPAARLCAALLDQHLLEHPAGLCACAACAVTKWRSRLTVWLHDWWLVGLCMTLHGLIRSYFIIWCAIDYTIICPSENHYGDQSIWFSILDVPWGCDIDPEDIFPEARRAVKARGVGRSWLSDDETGIEHQSRIDWHRRSSLLSLNVRPDLQMTTEWHLKDFEWSLTLELPW